MSEKDEGEKRPEGTASSIVAKEDPFTETVHPDEDFLTGVIENALGVLREKESVDDFISHVHDSIARGMSDVDSDLTESEAKKW